MPKYKKNLIKSEEVYKHYKKNVTAPVSRKIHNQILDTWGQLVADEIVKGHDVKLLRGLAVLGVRKVIQKYSIDGPASAKAGKLVRKLNTHSDFFAGYVYWARHYTTCGSRGWYFRACRKINLRLKDVFETPGGHKTYVEKVRVGNNEYTAKKIKRKNLLR